MAKKGDLAICGINSLGIVTEDEPIKIFYADGNSSIAYVGFHLTDEFAPLGSLWSSRNPRVVGHIDCDINEFLKFFGIK